MNKYDIAANIASEGLDGHSLRMPAASQRRIFGAVIFGKKQIRLDASNQGIIYVLEPSFEGTHTSYSEQAYSFDRVAEMVANKASGKS